MNAFLYYAILSKVLPTKMLKLLKECMERIPLLYSNTISNKLSNTTLSLIKPRRIYKRKLQRSTCIAERGRLISSLKLIHMLISRNISIDRNNHWNDFIRKLPVGSKKFWILKKGINGTNNKISSLNVNNTEIISTIENANLLADAFESAQLYPLCRKISEFLY